MLNGKVALVTGACGDIGRAIAESLARNGAKVVANDVREPSEAQILLNRIKELGGEGIYFKADVTNRAEVKAMMNGTVSRFDRIDICVANAGVVAPAPFLEITDENWSYHINVNLSGCFYVSQEAARVMVDKKIPGRIILTGSAVQDVPSKNLTAYCVSKSGLKMLAKCMALELAAYKINVNVVAPGIVDAGVSAQLFREDPSLRDRCIRIVPLGSLMSPQQVAEAVLFLCSPGADYMTGSTLLIDGGFSLFLHD